MIELVCMYVTVLVQCSVQCMYVCMYVLYISLLFSFQLSLADVTIYSVIEFFDMKGLLEKFPKITANMKQVEANKNIAKYLKERPPSELPPRLREQPAEENTRI